MNHTDWQDSLRTLRERIFAGDNGACFIERENLLLEYAQETLSLPVRERYAHEFELVLDGVSVPLELDERFAGRMVEGRWGREIRFSRVQGGLGSEGHITLPMERVLAVGLDGLVQEVEENARYKGDGESVWFAEQARRCIEAIRRYAERYAVAAEKLGKSELAKALRIVPYYPAYDLYSALQSIWLVHFVFSTICGARDFAPGRLDQYLLPFFRNEASVERREELLSFFLLKFNEITGTTTDNYRTKPIPTNASKQYVTLGGRSLSGECQFNEVTEAVVACARIVGMPQPTLNIRIGAGMPERAWRLVGDAVRHCDAQCNIFNDDLITQCLLGSGVRREDACNFAFTACNRVDLPGKLYNIMRRIDHFDNSFAWFREALFSVREAACGTAVERVLGALRNLAEERMVQDIRDSKHRVFRLDDWCFRLESLCVDSCRQQCRDIYRRGASEYRWMHRMFSGIANMGDSLYAVRKLVDEEKRLTLNELCDILEANFEGHETLRDEILQRFSHFGNGESEVDDLARRACEALLDAGDAAGRGEDFMMMMSLYSLTQHHRYGQSLGATPDGRLAGEQISENQSPRHGADVSGITSLLASVSHLPLKRCVCGGLNVKLGIALSSEQFSGLIRSYFEMGGQHIGFTVATRETLEKAMASPDEYRSLLVRKTGFSEYFVALSPLEQREIIARTEY